jgi:hypothetical protein
MISSALRTGSSQHIRSDWRQALVHAGLEVQVRHAQVDGWNTPARQVEFRW